jgi:signal transduction histidine kinase
MYTLYKDSLFNEKSNNQIALLKIQYETENKDREIKLLNKDKTLQEQQLDKQRLLRNGMIAGVFLIVLVGLLLFRSFRLRKKLERQQAIIKERHRISADLHDDLGSGLSRIMLLGELMKKDAKTPKSRKEAERIAAISHELSSNINEIVWALNSNNDYVENLVAYIRRYAREYFENSSVRLTINTPANIGHTYISGEHRRNIFFAVKEALHNIIKHAMATEAILKFTVKHNLLSIVIKDNGKGFKKEELNKFGNGLNNMRNRMKNINGNCIIENHKGARITLTLPV